MTAKYIADTNSLQELSQIKQPIKRIGQFKVGTREYYQNVREWAKYNSHTATLRTIPCDPSCREVFKDGEEYEEGKDYELRLHYHAPDDKELIAFPITVKTEDDSVNSEVLVNTWKVFVENSRRGYAYLHQGKDLTLSDWHKIYDNATVDFIENLKKHYTLIKK